MTFKEFVKYNLPIFSINILALKNDKKPFLKFEHNFVKVIPEESSDSLLDRLYFTNS